MVRQSARSCSQTQHKIHQKADTTWTVKSPDINTSLSNYHEVVRVHLQFLGVQHAQLCICLFDVVHVLHSSFQTSEDHLSVSCNPRIWCDSSSVVQVSKTAKVPLSPGVDNQTPEEAPKNVNHSLLHQLISYWEKYLIFLCFCYGTIDKEINITWQKPRGPRCHSLFLRRCPEW